MHGKSRKKLTTVQIANMIGVSDQSISNWIDAGQLYAERTPGGHRRVEREDLIKFLKMQKMRIPSELGLIQPTVLIIDDEGETAEWIEKILSEKWPNFRIFKAFDGFDAGRMIMAWHPDLVILDLHMPGMDGFDVCRRIKSDVQIQSTKILAITEYPSPQTEQDIRAAGAEAYLATPVEEDDLIKLISDMLNLNRL